MSRIICLAIASILMMGLFTVNVDAQDVAPPATRRAADGDPVTVKLFSLQYADAVEMERIVDELYRQRNPRPAVVRAANAHQDIRMSADARTNSLIVIGLQSDLAEIEALLLRLDGPTKNSDDNAHQEVQAPKTSKRDASGRRRTEQPGDADMNHPQFSRPERDQSSRSAGPPSEPQQIAEVEGTRLSVETRAPDGESLQVISVATVGKQVKQGDVLLTIDSTTIEQAIGIKKTEITRARAELKQQENRLERSVLQRDSQVADAELHVELAKLALVEFQEGTKSLQFQLHTMELDLAALELKEQEQLVEAGGADARTLQPLRNKRQIAEMKLEIFDKYTAPRMALEREGELATAERRLRRVRGEMKADVSAAEANLAAVRAHTDILAFELDRLQSQLPKYKVVAPHDGVVAAATGLPIRVGSHVRERQVVLILIPDNRKQNK